MAKTFSLEKALIKAHGAERAKRIMRRLAQLQVAEVLEDLRNAPGRCHQLHGNRDEEFTLDLDGPYRLAFRIANNPIPRSEDDGSIDWNLVTHIEVLEVVDTHD